MRGFYLNMAAIDFRYRINSQPYAGEFDDVAVQKFIAEQKKLKIP